MSKFGFGKLNATAAFMGLFLLAACEEDPSIVTPGHYRGEIVESSLMYAQSKGPVLLQVYGDPYGVGTEALGEKVRQTMVGHFQSPIIQFTGSEQQAGSPNIRIRIAFGYPESENSREICGDKMPKLSPNKEKLIASSVFCMDGEMLADASGFVLKADTHQSKKFEFFAIDLVRSVVGKGPR